MSTERTRLSTPLEKVERLLNLYRSEPKSRCRCVLLSTGSYNPIHRMHVESFYLARKVLEERNLLVVGAFLSPSHDSYVRSKLGDDDCIGTADRLNMCELSIEARQKLEALSRPDTQLEAATFLSIDTWESTSCPRCVDHHTVTLSLRDYLAQHFPEENIRVIYLCGSDHFFRCRCMVWLRQQMNISVAVVNRPSHQNSADDRLHSLNPEELKDVHVIETNKEEDCSSTTIRKKVRTGESISELVFSEVEDYMRKNGIYYSESPVTRQRRECSVQ